jgi:hypothetical protein
MVPLASGRSSGRLEEPERISGQWSLPAPPAAQEVAASGS